MLRLSGAAIRVSAQHVAAPERRDRDRRGALDARLAGHLPGGDVVGVASLHGSGARPVVLDVGVDHGAPARVYGDQALPGLRPQRRRVPRVEVRHGARRGPRRLPGQPGLAHQDGHRHAVGAEERVERGALLLLRLTQQLAGPREVRPELLGLPVGGLFGPRDARPARPVAFLGVLLEPLLPLLRLSGLLFGGGVVAGGWPLAGHRVGVHVVHRQQQLPQARLVQGHVLHVPRREGQGAQRLSGAAQRPAGLVRVAPAVAGCARQAVRSVDLQFQHPPVEAARLALVGGKLRCGARQKLAVARAPRCDERLQLGLQGRRGGLRKARPALVAQAFSRRPRGNRSPGPLRLLGGGRRRQNARRVEELPYSDLPLEGLLDLSGEVQRHERPDVGDGVSCQVGHERGEAGGGHGLRRAEEARRRLPDSRVRVFAGPRGVSTGGVDGVPPSLLEHDLAHRVQVGAAHGVRHDGVGDVAAPHRDVVHAAQNIIDPLPQDRGAAQAAPGALDGDEAAVIVVLVGGHQGRAFEEKEERGGFGGLEKLSQERV